MSKDWVKILAGHKIVIGGISPGFDPISKKFEKEYYKRPLESRRLTRMSTQNRNVRFL